MPAKPVKRRHDRLTCSVPVVYAGSS